MSSNDGNNGDSNNGNNNGKEKISRLLNELEETVTNARRNPKTRNGMKEAVGERGYDWFDNDNDVPEHNVEQVMNVFAAVVDGLIQNKVDLRNRYTEEVDKQLCQLLAPKSKSLCPTFFKQNTLQNIKEAKSPLDLAACLKKGVPHWFVENLIQRQFQIRWNTQTETTQSPNGEPDDYTFYQFCDKKNTTELLKYIPRRAHVQVTLYRECRKKNVVTLRDITKEKLCPKVYVRVAGEWQSWKAVEQQQQPQQQGEEVKYELEDVIDINSHLPWINQSIVEFITKNADEQKNESLADPLAKPTLYWAVMEDRDFMSGENLHLKEISQTQVYVGKANNGIKGRWMKDSDSHCKMMKKCLANVCAMTTYDPLRLEGIQLVDARLALAKVREEKTALFVIKTFDDDVEKAEMALHKAEASLCKVIEHLQNNDFSELHIDKVLQSLLGATESLCQAQKFCYKYLTKAKKSLSKAQDCEDLLEAQKSCCTYLKKAEVYLRQPKELCREILINTYKWYLHLVKESGRKSLIKAVESVCQAKNVFHAARATLQQLNSHHEKEQNKRQDKLNKAAAIEELEEAEKCHRDGDRVDSTKIIHEDDIQWLPKDMRYGMNNK